MEGIMSIKELQRERAQIFEDIYDGKIPNRVPISLKINWEACVKFSGIDMVEGQWNPKQAEEIMIKVNEAFPGDVNGCSSASLRNPIPYQILGSKAIEMSKNGFMQHPEIHTLEEDEYDEFIADPYKCMLEKLLPRACTELNKSPIENAITLAKAFKAKSEIGAIFGEAHANTVEKLGLASPPGGGFCEAPYDFLADFIRSFTGISKDSRRRPDKVKAACEAILPHMINIGSTNPGKYSRTFIPLHMAPFLNPKHFKELYWPTFEKLVYGLEEAGVTPSLFVEHDWMRFIDYLAELPGRIDMLFEYGDPKLVKEKVGKKHIISGLFPSSMLQVESKEKCIDKAKELLDVLAPGGGYIFGFDKVLYDLDDKAAMNLAAVVDYVLVNGSY